MADAKVILYDTVFKAGAQMIRGKKVNTKKMMTYVGADVFYEFVTKDMISGLPVIGPILDVDLLGVSLKKPLTLNVYVVVINALITSRKFPSIKNFLMMVAEDLALEIGKDIGLSKKYF